MEMAKETMNKKQTEILHDCYLNLAVALPLSQIAQIHQCSKAYVSQVCKGFGLKVNRKQGTVTAPISTLQKVFWPRGWMLSMILMCRGIMSMSPKGWGYWYWKKTRHLKPIFRPTYII